MYVGEIALNDHLVCLTIQIIQAKDFGYSQHHLVDVTVLYSLPLISNFIYGIVDLSLVYTV